MHDLYLVALQVLQSNLSRNPSIQDHVGTDVHFPNSPLRCTLQDPSALQAPARTRP